MALTLPIPGSDAQAHSRALTNYIAARVTEAGGWISFAEYMSLALYAPGLGYYSAGARKFGAEGDFVTAPELTPLFGRALARQAAQVIETCGGDVLELGAGSGRLAADMLLALDRLGQLPGCYFILEVSADLRQRQQARLAAETPHLLDKVMWLDELPNQFSGFIIGNEVLDALPVHLVRWGNGPLFERGCVFDSLHGLGWQERPLGAGPLYEAATRLPVNSDDYLSEINLAAPALIRSLADCLIQGLMVFIDYGFPQAEYYHPDRDRGTLMCHYRHQAFDDPFVYPGLVDITAHVDFTAMADAALEAGLDVVGYTNQAHFLLNCGLLEQLREFGAGSLDYLRHTAAAQKLIQPSEMGELFKVIGLAKGLAETPLGFVRGDKRHSL